MEYRLFGKTSWLVSALGLGCAPLQSRVGRRQSLRALALAFESGISFFDTANTYGQGGSESILGEFLENKRDKVILCTKAGQAISPHVQRALFLKQFVGPFIRPFRRLRKAAGNFISSQTSANLYSETQILHSVESSLRRLRTDYLDLLMLHSPSREILQQGDVFLTLQKLKQQGKIRGYGVAANSCEEALAAVAHPSAGIVCVQLTLNALDTEALKVLPMAHQKGIAIVARAPFANGRLYKVSPAELTPSQRQGLEELSRLEKEQGLTRAQAAIRYVLNFPQVSVVLPSITTEKHFKENLGLFHRTSVQTLYSARAKRLS